jgi:hypothetical protein
MRSYLFLIALGACTEPTNEMSLALPQQVPAGFDLSCVTAVDVVGHYDAEEYLDIGLRLYDMGERAPCVEISPQTTFEGIRNQIAGKFSLDLEDLKGVQIRGRVGSCKDTPNYHEAIFYGGAPYAGGDMTIPLVPNISCAAKETYKVRPIDISAMMADPTHACHAVTDNLATFPGDIRRSNMDPELGGLIFEGGTSVALLDAAGTASVASFSSSNDSGTCIAVAHEGQAIAGLTCVNKNAATLCGTVGEVEVPVYPFVFASTAIDSVMYAESASVVLGSIWETNPNKPIAGASVTAPAGVKVDYLTMKNGQPVVMAGATTTDASGMFLLYADKVVTLTVNAPGHQQRMLTAAGGWELDGTLLAVLPKL